MLAWETGGLVPAIHGIHVLYGLTGCAFEKVVQGRCNDEHVAGRLEPNGASIGLHDVREAGQFAEWEHIDEGLGVVSLLESCVQVVERVGVFEWHVDGAEDSSLDGKQVRREEQLRGGGSPTGHLLFHLRKMTVLAPDLVGRKVLCDFGEERT